jgi:hypothetical protein
MKDLDFFDALYNTTPETRVEGKLVNETQSKRSRIKENKTPKGIIKKNVNNSLKTLKESIKQLPEEKQNELIKEWESKRKESKVKRADTLKESEKENKKLKEAILELFPMLYKNRGKRRVIVVKSPYDKKSYKFKYELRPY